MCDSCPEEIMGGERRLSHLPQTALKIMVRSNCCSECPKLQSATHTGSCFIVPLPFKETCENCLTCSPNSFISNTQKPGVGMTFTLGLRLPEVENFYQMLNSQYECKELTKSKDTDVQDLDFLTSVNPYHTGVVAASLC